MTSLYLFDSMGEEKLWSQAWPLGCFVRGDRLWAREALHLRQRGFDEDPRGHTVLCRSTEGALLACPREVSPQVLAGAYDEKCPELSERAQGSASKVIFGAAE